MTKIPLELENAICNDNLILFIGAGLSYDLTNIKKIKLEGWTNLVGCILKELKSKGHDVEHLFPLLNKYEPIKLLELIEIDRSIPKDDIYSFTKDFFDLDEANNFELHKLLFQLSNKIITTNYDNSFEIAVPQLRKNKAYKGKNYELTKHKDSNSTLLFKLHGCFEDIDSMVLFPSNYSNLYNNLEKDAEHSLLVLRNIIHNKSILFIGTGMGDFQINNMFDRINYLQGDYNQKHFIITNKSLDSSLNFLTPLRIDSYSEISSIINSLVAIKNNCRSSEKAEIIKLRKQLVEANKKINELESTSDQVKLLERESLKYFSKGLEHSILNEPLKAIAEYKLALELKPDNYEALHSWGTDLMNLSISKHSTESEELLNLAFEKFQKAIEIKPDNYDAFNNWGVGLGVLASTKQGTEAEDLFNIAFDKLQKAIEIQPDFYGAYANWGLYLGNLADTKQGMEAEDLFNLAFKKYQKAIKFKPDYYQAFNNWGTDLAKIASRKQGKEGENLFNLAFEKYQKAIEIQPDYYQAFNSWGTDLAKIAETKQGKEAENLFKLAFEKFQKSIEIKPDNYQAYNNWGTDLAKIARTKQGKEAENLFKLTFEKFQKAIEIKPDNYEAFNNWGVGLGDLARTKQGTEAEDLFNLAFEKFQKSIEIKPDYYRGYTNWGLYLGNLARTKQGTEAENLFKLAFEKLQNAIEIKPDNYEAFNNWGVGLGDLARTKQGTEAEDLFNLAFEKFQKSIEITPDKMEALDNWGVYLGYLAKTKEGKEAEDLFNLAFDKLQEAYESGGSSYNISCHFAVRGKLNKALDYLEVSLSKNEIDIEFVRSDKDWKEYLGNKDFQSLLTKYKK